MGARRGNRNALKNTWCIIKGRSEEGKIQYELSDDAIDLRNVRNINCNAQCHLAAATRSISKPLEIDILHCDNYNVLQ